MTDDHWFTFGHQYPPEHGGLPEDAQTYTAYVIGDEEADYDDRLLRVYHTDTGKRLLELLPDEALALAGFIQRMYGAAAM